MNKYHIVFLSIFGILMLFLTPNVNTGDAGELITASYFLGIAHPSGYPLYLMLSKAISLLPFGNFAFKMALGSALFSSLSLTLLFWLVFKLTGRNIVAAFSVFLLLSSRSFLSQSVIVKFYPLNLFFITSIIALWVAVIMSKRWDAGGAEGGQPFSAKVLLLTAFLFGLILAHHHLGVLVSGPVLAAWLFLCPKEMRVQALLADFRGRRLLLLMFFLFLAGFSINIYLFIRGGDQFYNVFNVRNIDEFIKLITRQPYAEIGTASLARNAFAGGFNSVLSGFVNFSTINFLNHFAPNFKFLVGCQPYFMHLTKSPQKTNKNLQTKSNSFAGSGGVLSPLSSHI